MRQGHKLWFLISAKSKGNGKPINHNKNTSSIDFGANIGAGYKMDSGLNFALRYSLGLVNTYDGAENSNQTNATLQLSVGYFLN